MDDVELEIEMPPSQAGENTSMNIESGPRPLLNLAKFISQENDASFLSGKGSAKKYGEPSTSASGERIYKDYNVTLNFTDVTTGVRGNNKYYKIQLLQTKNGFVLYTEWGRVGAENPGSIREDFSLLADATKAFKKKFRSKTYNEWEDRDNFQPQPGKYSLLSMADGGSGGKDSINKQIQQLNKRNQEIKLRIEMKESKLEPRIFELMRMIWDINRMNRTLKELNFDTEKYPLGRLTFEQIQKGYGILKGIQDILTKDGNKGKLDELTNQFYTNIPQNFGFKRPPLIDDIRILREKVALLDALKELDIANKYINLAIFQKGAEELNPLDSFYNLLNAKINRVDPSENMFNVIQNCLRFTHGPSHDRFSLSVIDIFEVERKGEAERFWPFRKLNNRALLWHGSRVTNFVGILNEGLKVAPPEAPVTGYMFGKGVYFADVPSKSAGYCYATPESPEGLLMLCEVALGDMCRAYKAKPYTQPPKYFHSVYGVGKKKPAVENKVYINEAVLECGEVRDNKELENAETGKMDHTELQYNEFIVYDVGQVKIRYLIRVRFNYNHI